MRTPSLGPLLVLLVCATAPAQQDALTLERVLTAGPRLTSSPPTVQWLPGGHLGSVVLTGADGNQTMHLLTETGPAPASLTDARRAIAALGGKPPEVFARFPACAWVAPGTLRFELQNRVALWQPDAEVETVLQWPKDAASPHVAPGDRHVAWLQDHDLFVGGRAGGSRRLTHDGSEDIVYGGAAHRAEFGITTGLFWSPNGRWLAFSREDMRPIAPYPYQDLDAAPPRPVHGRYPMAGAVHSAVTIGVCDTTDGAVAWLEHDAADDVYWTNVAVRDDGKVFVVRVNRGQDHAELVRYDGATGAREAVLLREHDGEWLEPEHPPTFVADGRFLWWSRRDGFRHLWLCAADGEVLHQVTRGPFDVQALLAVDGEHVWFQAAGEDPRQLHLFRAALDGREVAQLTAGGGTHAASISPDRQRAWVTHSSLAAPPRSYLLDLTTGDALDLPAAPDPLAVFALPEQRFFTVTADDGSTLYGHVAIPPGRKPDERHPVLLYVYGGPHAQLVTDSWLGGAPLWLQAFAAEGFVVCRLDNRGTPNRGIEFEQQVFRRLGTIEVDDQLKAVAWLRQQPFADADRIGVHGWSYGGYMTLRLLLLAPDAFACGVSGAPVTDWAMYETGYTERYMDTPLENGKGYDASSCLPLAGRLEDPLLLVHGTDDRTVMWSHTLRFVDRCIDAGVELSYFPYPMQQHGLRGADRLHFLRLLRRFLLRNLGPTAR